MDNMLKMMEKYSSRLEDVVAERTSQLAEEKRKTDSLLYRMLPQYVPPFCGLKNEDNNNNNKINNIAADSAITTSTCGTFLERLLFQKNKAFYT